MFSVHESTHVPIFPQFDAVGEMPHTLTYSLLLKRKIDNLNELPKEKRPKRGLLDKPYQLEEYLDHVYDIEDKDKEETDFIEFNLEEAE